MLAKFPIDLSKVSKDSTDKELLRIGVIAELDAINLYEQLAAATDSEDLKKVFLAVAKEEKEHVGEFESLLLELDKEHLDEGEEGKKEVEEMLGRELK
jgi:rubrerythrin